MAADTSHAAWPDKRAFAVRLLPAGAEARELAAGLPDLLAAIDYAVEWLEREDPSRSRDLRLSVVETSDGSATEVWSYPPSSQPSSGQELVERFGFNPATWKPHVEDHAKRAPRRPPAPVPTRAPIPYSPPAPAAEPEADDAAESRGPARRAPRDRIRDIARFAWDDRASRVCVIAAAISVWLTITLASVIFVFTFLVAISGLWYLHRQRPTGAPDPDDWI